jgi:hypothetical protein
LAKPRKKPEKRTKNPGDAGKEWSVTFEIIEGN